MKVYILFQDIGIVACVYTEMPGKKEIEDKCFAILTDEQYRKIYRGDAIYINGGYINIQESTLT